MSTIASSSCHCVEDIIGQFFSSLFQYFVVNVAEFAHLLIELLLQLLNLLIF